MKISVAVIVCLAVILSLKTPAVSHFFVDADGGSWLLAGLLFSEKGSMPYIDFFHSYGPMPFVLSGIGQILSDNKVIGEVVLVLSFYAIGYYLLFFLSRRLSGSIIFASFLTVFALLLFPRFYKYYVLLLPMIGALAMLRHLDSPTSPTSFLLGVTIGIAWLFRHDYGVYVGVGAFIAVILVDELITTKLKRLLILVCGAFVTLLPWFVYLSYHDSFFAYFVQLWLVSFGQSAGLGLPHPLIHWGDIRLTALYLLFFTIPVFSIIILFLKGSTWSKPRSKTGIMLAAFSLVELTQSSHRADLGHLLQGIPVTFLLAAWMWGLPEGANKRLSCVIKYGPVFIIAIAALSLGIYRYGMSEGENLSFRHAYYRFAHLSLSREQLISTYSGYNPQSKELAVINALRKCTSPKEPVFLVPYDPQLLYFADRPIAGKIFELAPGFFDQSRFQKEIVASLTLEPPSVILWDVDYTFDKLQERNPVYTHKMVFDFVSNNYIKGPVVGRFTTFLRHENGREMEICLRSSFGAT